MQEDDEWPMPDVQASFDWSLSMRDIEKKYGPAKEKEQRTNPERKKYFWNERDDIIAKKEPVKAVNKNPTIHQINKAVNRIKKSETTISAEQFAVKMHEPGRIQTAKEFLEEKFGKLNEERIWEGEPDNNFHEV